MASASDLEVLARGPFVSKRDGTGPGGDFWVSVRQLEVSSGASSRPDLRVEVMGRDKIQSAEAGSGDLLPRHARQYVPPHPIPVQPDARTMENATIKLSPELDPRHAQTQLVLRPAVSPFRPLWQGLLLGALIGAGVGWVHWMIQPAAVVDPGVALGSPLAPLDPIPLVLESEDRLSASDDFAGLEHVRAPVSEESGEVPRVEPVGSAAAPSDGSSVASVNLASPKTSTQRPSQTVDGTKKSPEREATSRSKPKAAERPESASAEPGESSEDKPKVWIAPKERKVWLK